MIKSLFLFLATLVFIPLGTCGQSLGDSVRLGEFTITVKNIDTLPQQSEQHPGCRLIRVWLTATPRETTSNYLITELQDQQSTRWAVDSRTIAYSDP
jgi:hypothetical protein